MGDSPTNIFRQADYEIITSDTDILFQSKPGGNHSVVRFLAERGGAPLNIEVGDLDATGSITLTGGIDLDDDELLTFGDDTDFSIRYDSSRDELVIEDEINDTIKQTFDKAGDSFFPNGAVHIEGDSQELFLGQGDDASIQYDGTDLAVNPQEVGSGIFNLTAGDFRFGSASAQIQTAGGGGDTVTVRDTANAQDLATFNEGGDVDIASGPLNFTNSNSIQDTGTDAITFDGSQNVTVGNGMLSVTDTIQLLESDSSLAAQLTTSGTGTTLEAQSGTSAPLRIGVQGTGAAEISIDETGSTTFNRQGTTEFVINDGGPLDITSSPLNFSNSNNIQDAGTDAITFDGGQNVTVANGSLTVNQTGDKALHVIGDSFVGLAIESYRDSASDHALPQFFSARGTQASPSALQSGDRIVTFRPRGFGDTGFNILGDIIGRATETHTDSAGGMEWVFQTVSNGTTTATDALLLQEDQDVEVLNGNLNNKDHATQSGAQVNYNDLRSAA